MRNIQVFVLTFLLLLSAQVVGQTVNTTYSTNAVIGGTSANHLSIIASDNDTSNAISLTGNLTINGSVIFGAYANAKLKINIDGTSVIRPSANNSHISNGWGFGQLVLFADTGAKITVNVTNDLTFTGTNPNAACTVAEWTNDLHLTFSGAGQVEFVLSDGKTVSLTSVYESAPGTFASTTDTTGAGVQGVILMDHNDTNVWSKGVNKVVFSRKISSWDPNSAEMQNDITVSIGRNSFLTFASNNRTGLDPETTEGVSANETMPLLSAALAFDVSCAGPGRMVLKLVGSATANTYRDGALTIGGNLIDDGSGGLGSLTNLTHLRSNLQLNKPGGGSALLRITDEKAYAYSSYATGLEDAVTSYLEGGSNIALDGSGNPSSRGLWVINSCNSYPSMAANAYADSCWFSKEIFETSGLGRTPIRPGFVLAVNGEISIYNNTFVHHIANRNTRSLDTTAQGMPALATLLSGAGKTVANATKKHNSSALIIDGFSTYGGSSYQAYKYNTFPRITMWGLSHLIVSSGVTSVANGSSVSAPNYTIGTGTYNGYSLPLSGNLETTGEGEHVLDIQGLCAIRTFIDSAVTDTTIPFSRHDGTLMGQYAPVTVEGETTMDPQSGGLGSLSIGSVQIDYTGTFVDEAGTQLASWPLTIGHTYKRYNRGCINVNNDVSLRYTRLAHYDVSREITRDHVAASPAIVGGEYAYYASEVLETAPDIPTIWLENGQIHCHEGLCFSGLRLAVKEQVNFVAPFVEDNSSRIFLYNHGNALDINLRGYGRVLQLGTQANLLAGGTTASLLSSAYANVFRQTVGNMNTELVFDTSTDAGVLDVQEQSFQLIHLANASNLSVGWTSTQGIISRPSGPSTTVVYPWQGVQVPVIGTGWTLFSLDPAGTSRASLRMNGSLMYVSAAASDGGATPPSVISSSTLGGVVYVNHGGQLVAGTPINSSGATPPFSPTAAFDVPVGLRVAQSTSTSYNPMGTLTVPFDQINFLRGIQPYNIDTDFAYAQGQNIDLSFQKRGKGLTTDLTIPWSTVKRNVTLPFKSLNLLPELMSAFSSPLRSVGIQSSAVAMPTSGLLKFGAGTSIEQLGVAGATSANPFLLYMTGDGTDYATVREIVSMPSTTGFVPGEGAFAAIFMDKDAYLGIGKRSLNSNSANAWNLLGKNRVTLVPNGDCFIEVNEDIILSDSQPIIPTTNFGNASTHRITFYSESPREIRVPAGSELDLGAFGGVTSGVRQQVTFDGNIRLVFEPGSSLRFPAVGHSSAAQGPVLYMNGRSQLIFEGRNDRDNTRLLARNLSAVDSTNVGRSRILGCGKIWLNKNAALKIMDSACVGIEADSRTLETDVLVSIQKEASLLIGDPNSSGGILQVGNVTDLSEGGDVFTNVYFTLRVNGPRALVHMDRGAFFGIGAGVISRYAAVSGGVSSNLNNMTVQSLYNVADVAIRAAQGSFSHNQIYDGTSSEASLMALGPAGSYTLDLGVAAESIWRGGGNMVYVTENATVDTPLQISVLSTAQTLSDEYTRNAGGDPTALNNTARSANNGKVSIMGSGVVARQLSQDTLPFPGPGRVVEKISQYYLDNVLADSDNGRAPTLLGGKHFTGPQADMFRYLGFTQFTDQSPSKYCVLGSTQFEFKIGHVFGTTITRSTTIPMLGQARPDGAAKVGALLAATVDTSGNPALYTLPEVPNNPPSLFTAAS